MEFNRLDIVKLINNSPLTKLSTEFHTKLLTKIQESFTNDQQQLFVASFYSYLNYNSKTDFVINLDDVWKWCRFSRKGFAKTLLVKHFTENIDYKIHKAASVATEAGPSTHNLSGTRNLGGAGLNKETVLMTINTFKKFCLKAGTKKADEIHDYYIKLEELMQDTLKEESEELRMRLLEKDKKIELLENKPETEGFHSKAGYIYLIKDTASLGAYKIGLGENPDRRLISLNISSSQKSLKMINMFESKMMKYAEKMIHILLEPFRIKKRNEWFYLSNDLELNYAINIIKTCISCTDNYNFIDYNSFKNYAEKIPNNLDEIKEENIIFELKKPIRNTNFLAKTNKVSKYNGVCWSIQTEKWTSRLTKNNDTDFLGYYDTELEAAIAYNDYANYLNEKYSLNYQLNEIENYLPNPRDIPNENAQMKLENKSSSFNGVYFIKSKQLFEASIQYKKKSHKLIKHSNDIECAKVYNEQALYFNNNLGTKYKLNDIPNFITIEKNHIHELEITKFKKHSRFIGVSIRNDSNKFRSYIKHNGKVINCGTFINEIDAAKAYNKKAEELNSLDTTKIKYLLNQFN